MAFTHTGESGYCLYIPSEYALHVYSTLMAVGKDYGARDVGVLTQRFMRIERFIPFWAEELTPYVTPYEAGSGHSVKLDVNIVALTLVYLHFAHIFLYSTDIQNRFFQNGYSFNETETFIFCMMLSFAFCILKN